MERPDQFTIILADDHPLVRIGIKYYIMSQPEFNVVGEASNGLEALELVDALQPDIAIVDIVMPCLDGISLVRHLQNFQKKPKTILVTAVEEFIDMNTAFSSGADAIISKSVNQRNFIETLYQVTRGRKVYCKSMFQMLLNQNKYQRKDDELVNFTKVQQKIITSRIRGNLFTEIAQELNLTVSQIATEVSNILEKLDEYEFFLNSTSN